MKKFWDKYQFVIWAIVIWRSVLAFLEWVSLKIPVFSQTYMGRVPWANTDGINYIRIAQWGYGSLNEAFFPLYPLLIRVIHFFVRLPFETIGIGISMLCISIGLIVLYGMLAKTSVQKAKWCIVLILSFPTAFFFTAVYTESLFFLLVVLILYFSAEKKWLLASIFVGLASATRIVGICTAMIVLYEMWKTRTRLKPLHILGLFVMPVGLFSYMVFLYNTYGDPIRFVHIQAIYEINRTGGTFVLLPQVIWRYVKILLSTYGNIHPLTYGVAIGELVLTLGAFWALYYGWRKRMNLGYLIYGLVVLIIPTLTGTLMSMPRYILTIVPMYIALTHIRRDAVKYAIVSCFGLLQMIAVVFFLRGWFIA